VAVAAACGSAQPTTSHAPNTQPAPTTRAIGDANGGGSTTTATTSQYAETPAMALAVDESALSNLYMSCGGTCQYESVSTPDGAGGTLYAIEVVSQFPDGYGRGAVFFFHGESLLPGTGNLAPNTSVQHGSGLDWVLDPEAAPGISVPSPGHFAVTFIVSSGPNLCNACDGNAGTTTFTYDWNGAAMVVQSGTTPAPPAVIGDGTQ
jgi:hypothetical protein